MNCILMIRDSERTVYTSDRTSSSENIILGVEFGKECSTVEVQKRRDDGTYIVRTLYVTEGTNRSPHVSRELEAEWV